MKYNPLQQISILPLAHFRILFGMMMAFSIARFYYKGWIEDLYIKPTYFFTYYGFDWVEPFSASGMYLLFGLVFISALFIMFGFLYKWSVTFFFLGFTYIELIDKTNYLNHYYFVSLVAFLLIFLPANRLVSLDALLFPKIKATTIPRWTTDIVKFQLGIVYFFAGIAKLQSDWLFDAMPLKLWLPAQAQVPILGYFLQYETTAYLFCWFGAIYDLFIVFLLLYRPTRWLAYSAVVVFHVSTGILFQIGMFPYIMILATLIFFSEEFHLNIHRQCRQWCSLPAIVNTSYQSTNFTISRPFWIIFIVIQLLLPFRYLCYPGHLFWTEQGYRFSWRVMLMEKAGYTTFTVTEEDGSKKEWIDNIQHLSPQQEKMMSTQPDMILQYAHYLSDVYKKKGYTNPIIRCNSKVTLNGVPSQPFIDPNIDLTKQQRGYHHKTWILPFKESE